MGISKRELAAVAGAVALGMVAVYAAGEGRRQDAGRSACMSNLRQIGLGLSIYTRDYDETLPRPWFGRDGGPSDARVNYKWMDALQPYVKNPALFNCTWDQSSRPYRERSGRDYGSYAINNAYSAPGDAQSPPAGRSQSQIANPFGTILLLDGENDFQFSWRDAQSTPPIEGDRPFRWGSIRGRHGSGLYRSAAHLDCAGASSSATMDFAKKTRLVKGRKIYPMLTIEAD